VGHPLGRALAVRSVVLVPPMYSLSAEPTALKCNDRALLYMFMPVVLYRSTVPPTVPVPYFSQA